MAPPKQKAASYELIETGGGEGYGAGRGAPRGGVSYSSFGRHGCKKKKETYAGGRVWPCGSLPTNLLAASKTLD